MTDLTKVMFKLQDSSKSCLAGGQALPSEVQHIETRPLLYTGLLLHHRICIVPASQNLHSPTVQAFIFPILLTVVYKNTMENKDMLFHFDCIFPKESNYISIFPCICSQWKSVSDSHRLNRHCLPIPWLSRFH